MAGSASRIPAFCNSHPGSPGCRLPNSRPSRPPRYVNPCAGVTPLSIGTTSCKKYTTYVNVLPKNKNNLITTKTPIVIIGPNGSDDLGKVLGYTTTSFATMFDSFSSSGVFGNEIGDIELTYRVVYDTPQPLDETADTAEKVVDTYEGPSNVSSSATVNWYETKAVNPEKYLYASLYVQYAYHLWSIKDGAGYPEPFQTTAITTGQQLTNQKVVIDSSIIFVQNGAALSIANKLVFNIV